MLGQPTSTFTLLGGHLAISASMPSGRDDLVELRNELRVLLCAAGTLPSVDDAFGRGPSLKHLNDGACRHLPNVLYVGSVARSVDISPWSMPLPCDSFVSNVEFLRSRADYRELLWLIKTKTLVCDCNMHPNECWGKVLVGDFFELFGAPNPQDDMD